MEVDSLWYDRGRVRRLPKHCESVYMFYCDASCVKPHTELRKARFACLFSLKTREVVFIV